MTGLQAVGCHYNPNAFLMSVLLFIGTFLISWHLKAFKAAPFFPAKVRTVISDFAVIIAILSMTLTDFLVGVHTPKLTVRIQLFAIAHLLFLHRFLSPSLILLLTSMQTFALLSLTFPGTQFAQVSLETLPPGL